MPTVNKCLQLFCASSGISCIFTTATSCFSDASQVPDNQGNGVYLTKTQDHIWILTEPNMPNPFFLLSLCTHLSHFPPCSLITQLLFSSPFPVFSLDIHLYTQSLPDRCYQFRPWPEKPLRVSDRG